MAWAVRPATPSDAPRVAAVYVASWNAGFGSLMPVIVLDDRRVGRWYDELGSGDARWWVAEAGGTVVGLVGVGPSRDPVDTGLGELDTIAVDPAYWRMGVGTALMRTALDAIVEGGYREGILWTLANYERARRFYLSAGWRPDGGSRDDGRQVSYRHDLGT
jgi:ribosomal protein S18 acetylase RimI-like enzyme